MTTTRLLIGFICLLVIGEFLGCVDHRIPTVIPGANRLRVKTITQQINNPTRVNTVSTFSYDGQGRLSLIRAYQMPDSAVAPVEHTVYQYDTQNRLTQVQHSVVRRGSNAETYTLTYNGAGQLSSLTHSPSTFGVALQYNATNQVSTYSKSISVGGLQSSGGGALTFTGNNLTFASEQFSVFRLGGSPSAPPVYGRSISTTFTFDDKINPFYGVFIIPAPGVFIPFAGSGSLGPFYTLYGGIDNGFNLSQNNVLSVTNANGPTILYSYTYNAANLPTSRTTTTSNAISEILSYEYEPY